MSLDIFSKKNSDFFSSKRQKSATFIPRNLCISPNFMKDVKWGGKEEEKEGKGRNGRYRKEKKVFKFSIFHVLKYFKFFQWITNLPLKDQRCICTSQNFLEWLIKKDHTLIQVDIQHLDSSLILFWMKLTSILAGANQDVGIFGCFFFSWLLMKIVSYCLITPFSDLSVLIVERKQKSLPFIIFKSEVIPKSTKVMLNALIYLLRSTQYWF